MAVRDVSIVCNGCGKKVAWGKDPGSGDVYEIGLHESVTDASAIPANATVAQFIDAQRKIRCLRDGRDKVKHVII